MNENVVKRNELLAQTVIKGLQSRNMSGYYAENKEEALRTALSLIDEGSSCTMGGCTSAVEIGLVDALKQGNYNFIDRAAFSDPHAAALAIDDVGLVLPRVAVEQILQHGGSLRRRAAPQRKPRRSRSAGDGGDDRP